MKANRVVLLFFPLVLLAFYPLACRQADPVLELPSAQDVVTHNVGTQGVVTQLVEPTAEPTATLTKTAVSPSPTPTTIPPTTEPTASPTQPPQTLVATLEEPYPLDSYPDSIPLTVTFNQPMSPSSTKSPFLLSPYVSGRYEWTADYTAVTFIPDTIYRGRYTIVTLHTNLQTANGNKAEAPIRWRLEHERGVQIARVPGATVLTNPQPHIALEFDRPMNKISIETALTMTPELPYTLAWEGDTLLINLLEKFAFNQTYNFALAETMLDTDDIPFGRPYTWSYTLATPIADIAVETHAPAPQTLTLESNYPLEADSFVESIRFEPPIQGKWAFDSEQTAVTFTPDSHLAPDTSYQAVFHKPVKTTSGLVLEMPTDLTINTPPLVARAAPQRRNINPISNVEITFDRLMDEAATEAAFSIEPEINGRFFWENATLTFEPIGQALASNTDYTVTLAATATSRDGEHSLREPYSFSFSTDYFRPVASFGYGEHVQAITTNGRRAIHMQGSSHNMEAVLHKLDAQSFMRLHDGGFRGINGGWQETSTLFDTHLLTEVARWPLELDVNRREMTVPDGVGVGLYLLSLDNGRLQDQLFLIVTDQTLLLKQGDGQMTAWVSQLNGQITPNEIVTFYDREGRSMGEVMTNEQGVAHFDNPTPIGYVVATVGNDTVITAVSSAWRGGGVWWGGGGFGSVSVPHTAAHIYTDRPIYKPGQTVNYKAIIRQDDDAQLDMIPAGTEVEIIVRDARKNKVRSTTLTTNDFGSINGQFTIAEGAMLGTYFLEVVVEGDSHRQIFKVEDYRKPDYSVTVSPDQAQYAVGDSMTIDIDSSYFLGEPVANANVEINFYRLYERHWAQAGEEPYEWYQMSGESKRGTTDENGRLTIALNANTFQSWIHASYSFWGSNLEETIVAVEATVNDGSQQTVSSFVPVKIFSARERVTATTSGYVQQIEQPFNLHIAAETIAGEPLNGRLLNVSLRQYQYNRDDVLIPVQRLTTDASGNATAAITIPEPGYYQIRVEGRDASNQMISFETGVYAMSDSSGTWDSRYHNEINIKATNDEYAPGDTAQLLIESAFSGPALLTFERATTRREQLIELTAPLTMVEVPILDDDVPNIHVTVNAWEHQDTEFGERAYMSIADGRLHTASVNLSVPARHKQLQVMITPDKTEYTPREEATFTIRVTNAAGVPVSAEVSLAMVDEAIFGLSDELAGAIYDAFYFERERRVNTYHSFAPIRYLDGLGGGGGGGGDASTNPRSDFPDTAVWFPVLHTDFNGEVSITTTMPDSLTSWRLTAIATTADTQVGETFTNVLAKQTIAVDPIMPRGVTAGDSFQLSALVQNFGEETAVLTVSLADFVPSEATFDLLSLQSDAIQTVTVAPNGRQIVGWQLKAEAAGDVPIRLIARQEDDVVDAIELPLPIRPLAIPTIQTEIADIQGEWTTIVSHPPNALPQSHVQIELSRSIAGSLIEGLDYLTGFPYGCVEQTMSRALPNAVVSRAFFQLGIGSRDPELPAKVNASLQKLYGFQHNDGGWGWWYDDATDAYQTAWVLFGLAQIQEAGYLVDDSVLERGAEWLNENLPSLDPRTRAYALYSMAAANQPNLEATLQAYDNDLDRLDTFAQASLALALHKVGEREKAQAMVDLLAETAVSLENGHIYWQGAERDGAYRSKTMASDTRNTALALSAFAQIRPGSEREAGIVRWLMAQRKAQGWGTTNETSFAILGLTDHLLAANSAAAGETGYTVLLNGTAVFAGILGQGQPSVSLEIPFENLQVGANGVKVVSENGRLYATLNYHLYEAQSEIDAAGIVKIERTYLDPETNEPLTTVEPGQLVRVRLAVTLPNRASFMLVEDQLPGGLEALNENLNSTSRVDSYGYDQRQGNWQRLGYNHKEVFGDRVSFFITEMKQGTTTFTYMARALHTGSFVAMPTEAYAMYDLATWGRSASDVMVIGE
ncbi:MAG: Ig-like domain-containing protein [Chloroflexota bacterium]